MPVWQPSDITADSFLYGVLPLLLILAFTGIGGTRRWRETGLFAAVAFLMFGALRNIPVCAIVIAPLARRALNGVFAEPVRRLNELFKERAICALLYAGGDSRRRCHCRRPCGTTQFCRRMLPRRAIAAGCFAARHAQLVLRRLRLVQSCAALPEHARVHRRPLRSVSKRVWDQYAAVYRLQQGRWKHVLDGNHIDAVLADSRRPLAQELALQRLAGLVYSDTKFRLFMRADSGSTAYQHR